MVEEAPQDAAAFFSQSQILLCTVEGAEKKVNKNALLIPNHSCRLFISEILQWKPSYSELVQPLNCALPLTL